MTTFDEREKEFEAWFKHDQEFRFKTTARRNRLLGLWAAQNLGLLGDAAEAYAKRVVEAEFEPGGDKNVVDKLAADSAPGTRRLPKPGSASNSNTSPSRQNSS